MTTFDSRETGYEAKAAHDEEITFKAHARRDRKLAVWAGERMGLTDDALQDYVLAVWREDLKHPGDEDVYDKVMGDLHGKGVGLSEAELRARMATFLAEARAELAQEA